MARHNIPRCLVEFEQKPHGKREKRVNILNTFYNLTVDVVIAKRRVNL